MEYYKEKRFDMSSTVQKSHLLKKGTCIFFAKMPTPQGDKKSMVTRFSHSITAINIYILLTMYNLTLYIYVSRVPQAATSKPLIFWVQIHGLHQ